jgi:hypothetical protein
MSTSYTVKTGDVLLCDINTTQSGTGVGSTLTIPAYSTYTGGLCFNFHPGENVAKQLEKQVWVVQKPGVPVGYEIGLGERVFSITTTIKASTSTYASGIFRSLTDLNYLCNYQYNTLVAATSTASYGVIHLYYYGDGFDGTLVPVIVRSMWYEQAPGKGSFFDVRVQLSQVVHP